LIFVLDQSTKNWAVQNLLGQSPTLYWKEFFQLVYAENPGAFLGLGGDWSRPVRFVIFAVVELEGLSGML
jgi:signal peptidase II